jgi:superoxide dismutase, Cu-Zn family
MKKTLKRSKKEPTPNGVAVLEPNFEGVSGIIIFEEVEGKKLLKIKYEIKGLSDGLHGFHIHQYGDLRNGCISAGPHFNPFHHVHGGLESDKLHRHLGDLGNILSKDGKSRGIIYAPNLTILKGKTAIIGRMIVVHEREDDLGKGIGKFKKESLITGNAGPRVTCGIIGLTI